MTAGDEIEATAKAVEEVAKTTGKAIDAGSQFGGFLARVFGPALEEVGGTLHDQARFWRMKRVQRLESRYVEYCAQIGADHAPKSVDLKFGVPLIEAASLESNDDLQDMYARLLANATTEGTGVDAKRAFVTILQDFGPMEARLLGMIYRAPARSEGSTVEGRRVLTAGFPDEYLRDSEEARKIGPRRDVELALWNLCRLGCLEPAGTWGGGSTVVMVIMTALGAALHEACTLGSDKMSAAKSDRAPVPDQDWGVKFTSDVSSRVIMTE